MTNRPKTNRLDAQMAFLTEADQLKGVIRSNVLLDGSRHENVAEHSWHAALWALILEDAAPEGCDLDRAIAMLLIHDIVEIDAGDHPVHIPVDAAAVAASEAAAAHRLFGLLPPDQASALHALWQEFEAGQTQSAVYAKRIDHIQPVLQVLMAPEWHPGHPEIAAQTLTQGRAARLATDWPEIHRFAMALLNRCPPDPGPMVQRLAFLAEADKLKSVTRATRVLGGARRENSAEHSWHAALYALILAEHARLPIRSATVIRMLLLHDLVEIDAGDAPIFGNTATPALAASEAAAARRLFGLLPAAQGADLLALWQAFEAADTAEARFAKSLDRFVPPNLNLACGGGSWAEYGVSFDRLEQRVGAKIQVGAPALWDWIAPKAKAMIATLPALAP